MAEEKKKFGHGGKRPGAGRPRTYSKLITFRAQKDVAAYIEQHPNKSKFLQSCIIRNMMADDSVRLKGIGDLIKATDVKPLTLPMVDLRVVAGFPIPLDNDDQPEDVDILSTMCPHPENNIIVQVTGDSMIDADIHSGDKLIVDRSKREPDKKDIAICELNGEYTVKRVDMEGDHGYLIPANPKYPKIEVKPTDELNIWGVVTYIIHKA